MKNRLFALLLAVAMLFCLTACGINSQSTDPPITSTEPSGTTSPTSTPNANSDTPLYWRVTGNGYEGEFYLLGSIHVSDGIEYPQELLDAFDRCDALAVESDVLALENDATAQVEMVKRMLYLDGSTISQHIDADTYESAKQVLQQFGAYSDALDYYIPAFWSQLISNLMLANTRYSSGEGVDRYFLTLAKEREKTILEVEEYLDVYEALAGLSEQTQVYVLRQAVADCDVENYESTVTSLLSAWKRGDETELLDLIFEDTEDLPALKEDSAPLEYNMALVTNRNKTMARAALGYLQAGQNVFFVVGLAHMLGNDGIIALLRAQGYTVTPVEYER